MTVRLAKSEREKQTDRQIERERIMSSSTDPSSTPLRLSFCSLPTHLQVNPGMATPPLHHPASIPYKWEEAPGKPKNDDSGPRNSGPISVLGEVTRRLKLPPRLLSAMAGDAKSKRTLSYSGTVADRHSSALGPCYSFSFVEGRTVNKEKVVWPWSKAPGVRKMSLERGFEADHFDRSGSYYCYPYSTSDAASYSFSQRYGDHDVGNNTQNNKNNVRISTLGKNRSHARFTTSRVWESIYNSLKQVVSWRREKINV